MTERIKLHREKRPKEWGLLEAYRNIDIDSIAQMETILLDCVTIMVTNLIYDEVKDWDAFDQMSPENIKLAADIENIVLGEVSLLTEKLKKRKGLNILVTNEIGLGLVPDTYINRVFRDILGRVNQYIASQADEVCFCISGISLKLKGE